MSNTRYIILGITIVCLLIAFGIEVTHSSNKCSLQGTTSGTTTDLPCQQYFDMFPCEGTYYRTVLFSSKDNQGKVTQYNGAFDCVWASGTTIVNYIAFVLALIFAILFSRLKVFSNINPTVVAVVGGLAALSLIVSVALQAGNLNTGSTFFNEEVKKEPPPYNTFNQIIYIVNSAFSSLTALLIIIGTVSVFREGKRSFESPFTEPIIKTTY